jgi:hypothetical protein
MSIPRVDAISLRPSAQTSSHHSLTRSPAMFAAGGVFPRVYWFRRPECGCFIERRCGKFVLIERDKPSAESRWIYETAAAAARALVRRQCDHAFLLRPEASDEFVSVEYT